LINAELLNVVRNEIPTRTVLRRDMANRNQIVAELNNKYFKLIPKKLYIPELIDLHIATYLYNHNFEFPSKFNETLATKWYKIPEIVTPIES